MKRFILAAALAAVISVAAFAGTATAAPVVIPTTAQFTTDGVCTTLTAPVRSQFPAGLGGTIAYTIATAAYRAAYLFDYGVATTGGSYAFRGTTHTVSLGCPAPPAHPISNVLACFPGDKGDPEVIPADVLAAEWTALGAFNPFAIAGATATTDNAGDYRLSCSVPAGLKTTGVYVDVNGQTIDPVLGAESVGTFQIVK